MILGVSGDQGSFSEKAGWNYANTVHIEPIFKYLLDMESVLLAIEQGIIDVGIFPVVNSSGGLVRMAFDAMGNHLFKVIDELWLPVNQCLLIKPGGSLADIKSVVSHAQALVQCRNYLAKYLPYAQLIEWQDTAKAAKDLSLGLLPANSAVIAPENSASLYQLDVLARNIQDDENNRTAFIVVIRHEATLS